MGALSGSAAGDVVNNAGSQEYLDKNAGTGKVVRASGLTIKDAAGADMTGNYAITYVDNSSSVIDRAPLHVSLFGSVNKEYDGTVAASGLNNNHYKVTGWMEPAEGVTVRQTLATYANPTVAANLGTGLVTASLLDTDFVPLTGTDLTNYVLPRTASGTVGVITRAPLTLKVNNTAMFVTQDPNTAYDQGFSTGSNQLKNGESLTDVFGPLTRRYVGVANPASGLKAGVYDLTTVPAADNYAVTFQRGDLQVVPADQLLIHIGSSASSYGKWTAGTSPASTNSVFAQYCLVSTDCSSANIANLNMSHLGGGRWTATDVSQSVIGFDVQVKDTGAASGAGYLRTGTYAYGAGTLNTTGTVNFSDAVINAGVLTVTPRLLGLTASNVSKVYDGTTALTGMPLSPNGVLPGDVVTASSSGGSFAGKTAGRHGFELAGLQLQEVDRGNYALGLQTLSGEGTISPKPLGVSFSAADKTYDGHAQANVRGVLSGLVGDDLVTLQWGTANFASKNVARDANGQVISQQVAVTGIGLTGAAAANYQVVSDGWTQATIDPRLLTVVGSSIPSKSEDGSALATVYRGQLTGLIGQEKLALVADGAFDNPLAGNGKLVTVRYRLLDGDNGGLASNYVVSGEQLRGNILPLTRVNPVQPFAALPNLSPSQGQRIRMPAAAQAALASSPEPTRGTLQPPVSAPEPMDSNDRNICGPQSSQNCNCVSTGVLGIDMCNE